MIADAGTIGGEAAAVYGTIWRSGGSGIRNLTRWSDEQAIASGEWPSVAA